MKTLLQVKNVRLRIFMPDFDVASLTDNKTNHTHVACACKSLFFQMYASFTMKRLRISYENTLHAKETFNFLVNFVGFITFELHPHRLKLQNYQHNNQNYIYV